MSVSAIDSQGFPIPGQSKGDGLGMDKDMFLRLMMAQLQNQDPLSPTDDKEFVAQMAQFSSVEQMTNIADALKSMQASAQLGNGVALIGKTVEYLNADETAVLTGKVTNVAMSGGLVALTLDTGETIEVSQVESVS